MKRTNLRVFIIPIFVAIAVCITQCKEKSVYERLQAEVKEQSRDLPQKWDDILFLDSMTVIPPSTVKSYYSVRGMSIDLFHKVGYDTILYNFELYFAQTDEDIKYAIKNNITYTHTYLDPDGNLLCEFSLSPEDYNTSAQPKEPSMDFFSKLSYEETCELLRDIAKIINYQIESNPDEFQSLTKVETEGNILIYTLIAEGRGWIELKRRSADERKKMIIDFYKEDGDDPLYYTNAIFRFIFVDNRGKIIYTVDIPTSEFR